MSNSNKDATSSLQSVVDQVGATLQSGLGSLTGNAADKQDTNIVNVMSDGDGRDKREGTSKSRKVFEIVARNLDWGLMLLGPVKARFGVSSSALPPSKRTRTAKNSRLTHSQREADNKRATANAESDLSHATAKAGPFTATPGGGFAADDPNRTQGSWNQTMGSAKEAIGGLLGAEGLKQEGARQNKEGQGQEAQGQLSDLGKGVQDRIGGALGGAVAGFTGNQSSKAEAQKQHDDGKARQRGVEADLQKQAPQ